MSESLSELAFATATAHEFFDRNSRLDQGSLELAHRVCHIMGEDRLRMMQGGDLKPLLAECIKHGAQRASAVQSMPRGAPVPMGSEAPRCLLEIAACLSSGRQHKGKPCLCPSDADACL